MKLNLFARIALALVILITSNSFGQEILTGKAAMELYPNAQMVRTGKHSVAPSFIKFYEAKAIDLDHFTGWASKNLELDPNMGFKLLSTERDQLGQVHYRYQQTYFGKPVEGTMWILHTKGDKINSMNGLIYPSLNVSNNAGLAENTAMNKAVDFVGANTYKWELPEEEAHLKREQNDPNATYYPHGELVFVSEGAALTPESFRLAYKFNIYAHQPVSRSEIYVDASNGSILFTNEVFHHADAVGTAQTGYSGSQTITADSFGGSFRLRESGRGNGINTYDMNTGTSYGASVDFTDNDNLWTNANPELDEYATDAHWGAEMTYDYFWLEHNRNSIDGNGFTLNSYVHYDNNYANAFWDGQRMTYGDGNTTYNPFTAIDITGHEITHGLTNFTANLVYSAESGALNESFSDIFGAAIEQYALPTNYDWLMGEDIGAPLRSMSDPNSMGDPDTYFGNNWASLTGPDNGGVHTNSGVQNYWFYLLVEGGTGTNDNADNYSVNGIGWTEAGQIAFRNLTVYMTPSSDFAEARFYAIQSAIDLFGGCTPQVESCTNAWYAVGVGPAYVASVVADMNAPITASCQAPFTVDFSNLSINGTTFQWDFGDGNTSTSLNPSHTYSGYGSYTITLIADGGSCGIDTTVWPNYVDIDTANACIVTMPTSGSAPVQNACSGTLHDSGGPTGDYGANEDAQITISPIGAATVDINFTFFDVEAGQAGSCNYDYVEVYDGPNTSAPLVDTYCNNNVPTGTISSTGPDITIVFHSDPGVEDAGYEVQWNCVLPTVPPTANFISNVDTTCNGEVMFTDISTNGPNSWYWDFGDGNTSNQQDPTHNYSANGSYTVKLVASNTNGADSVIFTDLIFVDLPTAPTGNGANICENNTATLSATGTGSGDLDWYDQQTGGTLINTGTSYTTPSLGATTSYWVEENIPGPIQNLGPVDNSFGGGGFFNGDQHLMFDVTSPVTLKTVKVYANGSGNRYIELRNSSGVVVQSATIYIPDGEQVITLDFDLTVGTDWQLGTQPNSNQDLYRNNSGPSYPYTVGGGEVTITQASPGTGYYYFFYDWVIQSPGCTSPRTEVIATVSPNADATITPVAPMCSSDSPITLTAAETGGTWTGTGVSASTFDPSIAGNGTHTVTYTIPGMCGDSDQIDIVVADSYDATINAPAATICDTDVPLTLTAVDGGGVWSGTGITNAATGEFDPATAGAGTHTISYSIAGSCGDADTIDVVVEATPDASITPAGPFCSYEDPYQLIAAEPGGTWSADCGTCINATTGEFDPTAANTGTWTITYTISGNCLATDVISITVDDCLGVDENTNAFSIYPNPSDGNFVVQFDNFSESYIVVTDIAGRIVYKSAVLSDKVNIDLSSVAGGTYFLTVLNNDLTLTTTKKIQILR
ncbi:MAG: M4 family metallopeptidase [Crocinitomicaceae bacterium]|nr:M4 family metallopeptidase [Crocinitomicaceae bacterium]